MNNSGLKIGDEIRVLSHSRIPTGTVCKIRHFLGRDNEVFSLEGGGAFLIDYEGIPDLCGDCWERVKKNKKRIG